MKIARIAFALLASGLWAGDPAAQQKHARQAHGRRIRQHQPERGRRPRLGGEYLQAK
jgi:hypothetical protein